MIKRKLVLLTGMSGAGKSVALKTLEDCGFEAIDNLPLSFINAVATSDSGSRNLAIVADIRSRDFSSQYFLEAISEIKNNNGVDCKILFLDADDETLQRRFSETRRRHPLAIDRPVIDGIHHERKLIDSLRKISDMVIDTSETAATDLRKTIIANFAKDERKLSITITSFSFKNGVPRDADMVFDVRFLKNPHYESGLRELTGLDAKVGEYVEKDVDAGKFFQNLTALIIPLLPRYMDEGKNYLTISIGCTGGRHRSVYMAEKLTGFLKKSGYEVAVRHRDLTYIP